MRTRILIIFLILIACAVGVFLVFMYVIPKSAPQTGAPAAYPSGQQINAKLISSNAAFKQGVDAYNSGDWVQAASDFKQARAVASDHVSQGAADLWTALSLENAGDYEQAVGILKNIAADTYYIPSFRAGAVQELGLMYYRFLDPRITQAIFSNAPYQALYTDGKIGLSYRKLFEYATSMYPLAQAELRAALWYANQLLSPTPALTADAAKQAQYKQTIKSDVAAADIDIATMTNGSNSINTYLSTLLLRANLVAKMTQLGDTSYGNPEDGYKQLLALYASNNISSRDGVPRIYYAGYLAQTSGSSRASDITTILAPLTGTASTTGTVNRFLSVNRQSTGGTNTMLTAIAGLDPGFETLLMSNGWTAADFK